MTRHCRNAEDLPEATEHAHTDFRGTHQSHLLFPMSTREDLRRLARISFIRNYYRRALHTFKSAYRPNSRINSRQQVVSQPPDSAVMNHHPAEQEPTLPLPGPT